MKRTTTHSKRVLKKYSFIRYCVHCAGHPHRINTIFFLCSTIRQFKSGQVFVNFFIRFFFRSTFNFYWSSHLQIFHLLIEIEKLSTIDVISKKKNTKPLKCLSYMCYQIVEVAQWRLKENQTSQSQTVYGSHGLELSIKVCWHPSVDNASLLRLIMIIFAASTLFTHDVLSTNIIQPAQVNCKSFNHLVNDTPRSTA